MELHKYIQSKIENCFKVVNILPLGNDYYRIEYIEKLIPWIVNSPPQFSIKTDTLNLKVVMRDIKIQELLNSKESSEFDVESFIYNDDQREKLHTLRRQKPQLNCAIALLEIKKEYSNQFSVGDRVWYNNGAGFITFKHEDKHTNKSTRFSVKVKNVEYRYVHGTELVKRNIEDLSHIPIDKELNKLSTEKLLKIYKRKRDRNKGKGDIKIKRILQDREHIQKGENKIIIK